MTAHNEQYNPHPGQEPADCIRILSGDLSNIYIQTDTRHAHIIHRPRDHTRISTELQHQVLLQHKKYYSTVDTYKLLDFSTKKVPLSCQFSNKYFFYYLMCDIFYKWPCIVSCVISFYKWSCIISCMIFLQMALCYLIHDIFYK